MKTAFTPHRCVMKELHIATSPFNFWQIRPGHPFKMLSVVMIFIMFLITGQEAFSQCTNGAAFGTFTAPSGNGVQSMSTCIFGGEYNTINGAVAGSTYVLSASGGIGNYLTIHQGTPGGLVLGFGFSPVSVTVTVSGPIYLHVNTTAACGTDGTCHSTFIQCTSCAGVANDLCSGALPISCGQTITSSTAGAGIDAVPTCITTFGTAPGLWYTFQGDGQVITLSMCGSTYDTKLGVFSGTCASLTCVTGNDDFCGLQSQVSFTSVCGTTYFVLATGFSTNSGAFTLIRTCTPPDPCTSIGTLVCTTPVTASVCGPGAWGPGTCGFSTPGKERVYSFTAVTTGMHTLMVTAASGGIGDYFFKLASGGCSATGWTCIGDASAPESDAFGPLTAGITYYILFDSEVTAVASQTFRIDCPPAGSAPACIASPTSPVNGSNAGCPNTTQILTWPAAPTATSYDVYFGSSLTPPFVANVATTSYTTGSLAIGTYYWQILPRNASGAAVGCAIWSFTKGDILAPVITCPANVTVNNTTGLCTGVITYGSTSATDNCNAPGIVLVSGPASGSTNPVGVYTIIFRATDAAGNSSTCSFTATVKDNQPPTITCPAPVTIQCASLVPASNIASVTTADNCGVPTVTFVSDVTSNQTCANRYTITRTYRSTDASGNSSTCAQIITVFDNIAPVITFTDPMLQGVSNGGTFDVQCNGQDPNWDLPTFSNGSISAADNCSGGAINISYTETLQSEGNCSVNGYINIYRLRWIATDVCGNTTSSTVFMRLVDDIPPVIHGVPADISVSCDAIPAPPANVFATDECLCACILTYAQSNPTQGCQNGQTIQRTWTAKDDCGNQAVAVQNITLIDIKGPELQITQPEIAGATNGSVFEYTCNEGGIPEFYDHMNAGSVFSPSSCGNSQITFDRNNITANNCDFWGYIEQKKLNWTGIDQCGNKTELTIYANLIDNEAPVLTGVPDIICMDDFSLNSVEATDNCGHPSIRYWDITVPNPCGAGFAVHRTYEAYDDCGNMTRDTAILVQNDHTHPNLTFVNPVLANLHFGEILIIECNGRSIGYSGFRPQDAVIQDGCSEGSTINFNERVISSGTCEEGIIAVLQLEWSSTDICGNYTIETVTAHVVDHTPPVLVNFKSEMSMGCNDAMPEISASDNCGEAVMTIHESIVPGNCANQYDLLRTIIATDPCGNTTTQLQTIHVGNTSGPIMNSVEEEICDNLLLSEVTAYDPCSEQFVQVTMTQDTLAASCRDGYVIERTWTASDACGHVSHVQQRIIVGDNTPPEIQIPTHSVIRNFLDNGYSLVYLSQKQIVERLNDLDESSIFVQDDCDRQVVPEFNVEVNYAFNCQEDGYYERRVYSWVASDLCGNESVLTFSVDIMDDLAPEFVSVPQSATFICQQLPLVPGVLTDDPAGPVGIEYTQTINPGSTPGSFDVVRTWIATDACGNSSSAEQHISWIPDTGLACDIFLPSGVNCNTHGVPVSSGLSGGLGGVTYSWEVLGEECFIQSGQGTDEILIYIGFSPADIVLTVADAYGCSTVCSSTLDCSGPVPSPFVAPSSTSPRDVSNTAGVKIETGEDLVKKSNLAQWNLWPNPANGTVNVSFESHLDQNIQFTLTNLVGQRILSEKFNVVKGFNTHKLDVAKIPEGSYLMEMKTAGEMKTKVVVILHHD
ncbi:MAG TPA: T9SS type A sorting domain-containing protein [Saprospiraceae bacterium]|nr:T9SS type A sorting domain-containing protein [Saprospiraceae bacterium]